MQFISLNKDIVAHKSDVLLIITAAKDGKLYFSPLLKIIDRLLGGGLAAAAKNGYCAAAGEVLTLHFPTLAYSRVVLVGRGDAQAAKLTAATTTLATTISKVVSGLGKAETLTLCCHECGQEAAAVVAAAAAANYRFKLGAEWFGNSPLKKVYVAGAKLTPKRLQQQAAIGEGAQLARHLAEQPGNICTPTFLAQTAKRMAKNSALKAQVLNTKQMEALKMGGILAVARGSVQPPKMIILEYKGAKGAPVVLVGKGVTFDSGGISIKPSAAMDEMKFDMGGAASVLGAMWACARMKLPLNVVAIVPSCENMPDGAAVKPGDVITMANGKTVEVLNTDAEGRLLLADALTYSARYRPAAVIDAATLTGACVIALGHTLSGLMSNDDKLAAQLQAAGATAGDECWRLPVGGEYDKLLKSDYADLANIGGRAGGTITAACFLSHFVTCESWAHLDIAGTAWTPQKRATGRVALLLAQFLQQRAQS